MPVQISSLRVVQEFDASKYVAGMQQKIAADQAGAASSQAVAAAISGSLTKIADNGGVLGRLSRQYVDGYTSASRFEQAIRDLGRGIETGNVPLDRVQVILEGIYKKFGLAADSTQVAQRGQLQLAEAVNNLNARYAVQNEILERSTTATQKLAAAQLAQATINERLGVRDIQPGGARAAADAFLADVGGIEGLAREKGRSIGQAFQDSLNASFGIGGSGATSRGATFSALEEQFNRLEEIARAKTAQFAQATQAGVNSAFGIGAAPGRSARDSAAVFEESIRQSEEMDRAAQALRQQISPLDIATEKLNEELALYAKLAAVGKISTEDLAKANELAQQRFHLTQVSIKGVGEGSRLTSSELANLGYQLNDVLTGIALGQSPFMILAQQGGQVIGILQNSRAAADGFGTAFREAGKWVLNLLTPFRLVVAGTAGLAVSAVAAVASFQQAQREITLALSGIGRASGTTAEDINHIGDSVANINRLSVSEARSIAAQLAGTGQIVKENIESITGLAFGVSKTFGTTVAEAGEMLAKTFSDPVRGADELNRRLGFLDAGMQRNIKNLSEQNRLYDVQQVLLRGVQGSLAQVDQVTGFWSRTWNTVSNAASNTFDAVGRQLSQITGIGQTLTQQLAAAREELTRLESSSGRRVTLSGTPFNSQQIVQAKQRIDELTRALEDNARQAEDTRLNLESLKVASAISTSIPEVAMRNALENARQLAGGAAEDPLMIQKLGLTQKDVDLARNRANEAAGSFISAVQRAIAQSEISIKAINARSPVERELIARQQKQLELAGQQVSASEKSRQVDLAGLQARKEVENQLTESARSRRLTAQDQIDGAFAELRAVGRSAEETARLRANFQSYAELRREANDNHTEFDQAQYERLVKINGVLAKTQQLLAETRLKDDISFERKIIGLPDSEQRIAQTLKPVFGSDLSSSQAQFYAQQLRINEALRFTSDLGKDAFKGFIQDLRDGKSAAEALENSLKKVADKLIDLALDSAFGGISQGLKSNPSIGSSLASIFGGGGGTVTPGISPLDGLAAIHHSGLIVGGPGIPSRYIHPAYFENANRFRNGGIAGIGPDEVPIVAHRDEEILRRDDPRHRWNGGAGGDIKVNNYVTNNSDATVSTSQRRNQDGSIDLFTSIDAATARAVTRPGTQTNNALRGHLGVTPRLPRR